MTTEELAELIATEIANQGNEVDNLGDCDSIILLNEQPVIDCTKLAALILAKVK